MRASLEDRDTAIVEAYVTGQRIQDIEQNFGVSRSSLYLTLRRHDVPLRADRHADQAAMTGVIIAGLRELVALQAAALAQLREELAATQRALGVKERAEAKRQRRTG